MMKRETVAILTAGATLLAAMAATAQEPPVPSPTPSAQVTPDAGLPALPPLPAAPSDPNAAPLPPAAPGAVPAAPVAVPGTVVVQPGTVTTIGTAPALPGLPSYGGIPGVNPATAVPTPPPLGNLNAEAADTTVAETTASLSNSATPSQLYTFLFIEDPETGVVRQKFNTDVANTVKEAEINRLLQKRMTEPAAGTGAGLAAEFGVPGAGFNGMDPALGDPTLGGGFNGIGAAGGGVAMNTEALRAAAEWDFYYDQLEMYDRYVREKLVPDAQDLPTLAYDAANALQERQDLFESFQEAAITRNNDDFNDTREFYERLQKREDRRTAYHQWIMHKQNEVAEWAEVWARQVFGTRWADGEEVRVDDWYYGTDFNSAEPVLVQMDNREYIVSKKPVSRLQEGQLNVISSNMTPYDIIDNNGYLKNPQMETLRGTLVIPPVGPVYSTGEGAGTIELVPGTTSE